MADCDMVKQLVQVLDTPTLHIKHDYSMHGHGRKVALTSRHRPVAEKPHPRGSSSQVNHHNCFNTNMADCDMVKQLVQVLDTPTLHIRHD